MPERTHPTHSPWRLAWHRWAQRRQASSPMHTLVQGKLYVLPSKAGCMLGATLLVLLMASINFQLNLGYALTFLIAGSALSSLWVGYRNVYGLQLQLGALKPTFQGDNVTVPVLLHNPQGQRHGIALAMHRSHGKLAWVYTDVPPLSNTTITLGCVPRQRGWHPVPGIVIESRYPLGVFRIWSHWQPDAHALVYPAPEVPAPALHFASAPDTGHAPVPSAGMAEHDGVRSYQRGDALRSVVWKKTATALATGSGDVVVRNGQQPPTPSLWLDARATGLHDPEAQIARLTAWVLHAHAQQWRWGLKLPSGQTIAPATGDAHLHHGLAALALDGQPQNAEAKNHQIGL